MALSCNGVNGFTSVYLDGILEWSGNIAPGTSIRAGGSLVIGQEQDSLGAGFAGYQGMAWADG